MPVKDDGRSWRLIISKNAWKCEKDSWTPPWSTSPKNPIFSCVESVLVSKKILRENLNLHLNLHNIAVNFVSWPMNKCNGDFIRALSFVRECGLNLNNFNGIMLHFLSFRRSLDYMSLILERIRIQATDGLWEVEQVETGFYQFFYFGLIFYVI